MGTRQEAEGVDAVVGVDEDYVAERGGIEDWITSWWDSEGSSAFDECAAEEDNDYGAEGRGGDPGS